MAMILSFLLLMFVSPIEAIGGGKPISISKTPYLVGIRSKRNSYYGPISYCVGALITPRHVLTAATCMESGGVSDISHWEVVVGAKSNQGYDKGERISVVKQILHPKFGYIENANAEAENEANPPNAEAENSDTESESDPAEFELPFTNLYGNNLLILELERNVEKGTPLPLSKTSFDLGTKATVAGWGSRTPSPSPGSGIPGAVSETLLATEIRVVEQKECAWFPEAFLKLDEKVYCARGPRGEGACSLDWGTPMVTKKGNQQVIMGIFSNNGAECLDPTKASPYSDVSKYMDFIMEHAPEAQFI